jgi:Zn-dependent protease
MDSSPQHQWLPPSPPGGPWQPVSDPPAPFIEERPSLLKRLTGPFIVAGALLLKFGKLLLVGLKGAKFLTTSLSMLISIGAYALIWGFPFAVGFVGLLFIHEMGHYIQMRREGIRPSAMVFIPFLGAAVAAKSLGGSALAEARVGLAGPILGSIAAGAVAVAGIAMDSDFLRALAFTGLFLNLFNLLPVSPLDGGRAMAAVSPWMWFVGLFALIVMVFVFPNPIIILIALFAAFETYKRWKERGKGYEDNEDYYRVSNKARLVVFAVYLGLVIALVVGMDLTFVERDFGDA